MEKKDLILSASRIKTLETCSWTYWCNYHLKLPDKSNDGANRGTVCHLIFELLLNKKHKSHFVKIQKQASIKSSKAINRLVIKHMKKLDIYTDENYEMVDKMIVVGLNQDFYLDGAKLGEAEQEFLIDSESPKYKIRGFIDKNGFYPKDKLFKIVDYKSSKVKFKDDELTANIQALTYTLATKKSNKFKEISGKIKRVVAQFIFLRFPKQPVQEVEITEEQLNGYEKYLEYIYEVACKFSSKTAISNFAADSTEKKWLCKAGKTWVCPYYHPYKYYEVYDENEALKKTYFIDTVPAKLPDGYVKKLKQYDGCPAHNKPKKSQDAFDF